MKRPIVTIDDLLRRWPERRRELLPYADKARRYANECGCAHGAAFLTIALALVVASFFFRIAFLGGPLKHLMLGLLFAFFASIIGKLLGIGYARLRLALLYRHLAVRYQPQPA